MRAAQGFGHDAVDHAQFFQVLRGQAHGLGRFAHLLGILPQDRGAALGRNHRIDRMFQHCDAVGRGKGHRPARAAFADDHGYQRHADLQAGLGRAGDRLGLAAFFRALAGIGPGGVDQCHHGQVELVGHLHQAHGLAVAFGARHAEIAFDPAFGVVALFMADDHDGRVVEPGQAAHDGVIVGKVPVARQRRVFGEQCLDIVLAMGPVGMPRHLAFPPRCQGLVQIPQHRLGLGIQALGLGLDVHAFGLPRHGAQLSGLAFNLGQGLFEIQIAAGFAHGPVGVLVGHWDTSGLRGICPRGGGFATLLGFGPDLQACRRRSRAAPRGTAAAQAMPPAIPPWSS